MNITPKRFVASSGNSYQIAFIANHDRLAATVNFRAKPTPADIEEAEHKADELLKSAGVNATHDGEAHGIYGPEQRAAATDDIMNFLTGQPVTTPPLKKREPQ